MTTHSAPPPSGLGRGLASLIPQRPAAIAAPTEIPIVRISRNPYQPRRAVDQEAIEQLAASIRAVPRFARWFARASGSTASSNPFS